MTGNCITNDLKWKSLEMLSEDQLMDLSRNSLMITFKRNDSIIKQGVFSTNVVYLRSGLVKIHLSGPSREQVIRIVKASRYLGLPTTIGDKINQYSVTAISDVEVCFIDINAYRRLLKESELFSYEIILDLCREELESMRRCASRTQKQTRGNIADVILDFADNIFESDSFVLPISQTEIGNFVDASRESVSRILTEFHHDGIINFSKKRIEILNKKSLVLISQNG